MISRLCLGTVQFGLAYGIANAKGQVPKHEAYDILKFAKQKGLNTLDTSMAYGESQNVIGEYITANKAGFDIVSKILVDQETSQTAIGKKLEASLKTLCVQQLYGCLIHKFDDFKNHPYVWESLLQAKQQGVIKKIGFSLYRPEELEWLWNNSVDFDIVQVPFSVFDRRFEDYFKSLKEKNVEIHVRSIFLQGLAFLEPKQLRGKLESAYEKVAYLREISQNSRIPINAICLNEALLNPYIDKVIIGCDSVDHLKTNIDDLNALDKVAAIKPELKGLSIADEDILLPFKWNTT